MEFWGGSEEKWLVNEKEEEEFKHRKNKKCEMKKEDAMNT